MGTWDNIISWDMVLPPSRPSLYHLDCARRALAHVERTDPVAILGSTPEFRDLLVELGFVNISVIDNNPSFYQSMAALRIYNGPETFIEGDWTDVLQKHERHFGAILSDLTSGNIPYDDRSGFYSSLSNSLKDGGLFFDKVLTHRGKHLSIASLSEKYSGLPLNMLYVNHFSCEFFFCSELLDLKSVVDTSFFYQVLSDKLQHPRLQAFLKHVPKVTPPDCLWYYGKRWADLQRDYCPELKRLSVIEEEDGSPYQTGLKLFVHIRE